MPRRPVPLGTDDLSRFARTLARELQPVVGAAAPSHLSLMNMLARAAGFRNFQHLRAAADARRRVEHVPSPAAVDHTRIERALRHFDGQGRLFRWPRRNAVQKLVLWVFWAELPARAALPESVVNARLRAAQTLDDPATIRRMLVGLQRVRRARDGSAYQRMEGPLPREAAELIRHVRARRDAAMSA